MSVPECAGLSQDTGERCEDGNVWCRSQRLKGQWWLILKHTMRMTCWDLKWTSLSVAVVERHREGQTCRESGGNRRSKYHWDCYLPLGQMLICCRVSKCSRGANVLRHLHRCNEASVFVTYCFRANCFTICVNRERKKQLIGSFAIVHQDKHPAHHIAFEFWSLIGQRVIDCFS